MSLTSSLMIGRSALAASQLAVQVAGDNLANAATPGFSRRVATLEPTRGSFDASGIFRGRGVEVQSITRRVDEALQARLRASISENEAGSVEQGLLSQVESLVSELDGIGLGTELNEFLNAFSELANNPNSAETRALIVEQGKTLAGFTRELRQGLTDLRAQVDEQLTTNVARADELLSEIASVNRSLVVSEGGRGEDASLRDQRDQLLSELSELVDISVTEQESGAVDVHVGSTPLVLGDQARGLEARFVTSDGEVTAQIRVKANGAKINPESGRIGGLLAQRNGTIEETRSELDRLASALIFEVNRRHSVGRGAAGLTEARGTLRFAPGDQTVALNDPANASTSALPFGAVNGAFTVVVRDAATGAAQKTRIDVDLDGIDSTGAAGFADDTSLASLAADLDSVANLSATIDASGRLSIAASDGFEVSFEEDTSGALATLGVNTFFEGTDARDIGVRAEIEKNPQLVVAGAEEGSNEAALAIVRLREEAVDLTGGVSLGEAWRRTTERVSIETRSAGTRSAASGQVRSSLDAQRLALSGVSVDEETVNLLNFQRQYQAAARFISTVDEMTNLLIGLI